MVTSLMCMRSMTRRITSTGQGEPAMMPVRSVLQIEAAEFGVVEHGDEHRRYAVQPGAAFSLDRFQRGDRIEPFRRADHA